MLELDKLDKKINIYRKKMKVMGLDKEENDKLVELVIRFTRKRIDLNDNVFDEYVLPYILEDDTVNILNDLIRDIGWRGQYISEESEEENIVSKFNEVDKKDTYDKLCILYNKLCTSIAKNEEVLRENLELEDICLLISDGMSKDYWVLLEHIRCKFQRLDKILNITEGMKVWED